MSVRRMNRVTAVVFVCVVVLSLVGFYSVSPVSKARANPGVAPPSKSITAPIQNNSLVVRIVPAEETLYEDESKLFHLILRNPPKNDERFSGFLYAGYEVRETEPSVTIAGQRPNVRYRNVTSRYLEFNLTPGGTRVFPILVHRDSEPGKHRLNTTVRYFEGWNFTKQSSVALVNIEPEPCGLPCQIRRVIATMITWLENNWAWLVSVASLLVALLSLLAPNRVRRTVGLSAVSTDDSTENDD